MASSGWQGEKYIHGWGSYNSRFVANLNVISIIRYKTSIKLKGQVRMTCYSNATSYYYYAINAYVNEQGIGEIKPYTGSSNIRNSSWTKDFEVTIGVSEETTTANVPIRFHDPTTNWVRETVYYQINFDKGLTYPAPDISNATMTAESTAPYEITASITGVDFKTNYSKRVITCVIQYTIDGETFENTLGEISDGSTSLTVNYSASTEEEPWKKIPDGEQAKVIFYVDNGNGKVSKWMTVNCQSQYNAYVIETIPDGDKQVSEDFTGSEIQINNQIEFNPPLASFSLLGNATQETLSGKNLFDYTGVKNLALGGTILESPTYRGYYIAVSADEKYTISRKTTTENNRFRICFTQVEPANLVAFYNEAGTEGQYVDADSLLSKTVTIPSGMNYLFVYLSNNNETISASLEIQIEKSASQTSYEPYVGGVPSPNPSYPQDVNVVTGAQTVKITGKNLADNNIPTTTYGSSSATIEQIASGVRAIYTGASTSTPARYRYYKLLSADYFIGKTLSLSFDMAIGGPSNNGGIYVGYCDEDGSNRVNIIQRTTSGSASGVVPAEAQGKWLCILFFANRTGSVSQNEYVDYTNVQLEIGDATTYEPYQAQSYTIDLDTLELCKIDDYQDYIYKSGDKWYKHAEFGKVVLNGSENWSQTSNQLAFYITVADTKTFSGSTVPSMRSDYYTAVGYTRVASAGGVDYGIATHTSNHRITIRNKDITTIPNFQTWLSTHNTSVYYALDTPTDTEITDTELINELENLMKNFRLYDGVNNIFEINSSGAQGEIEISYYTYWQKFTEAVLLANAKNGANQFKEVRRIGTK